MCSLRTRRIFRRSPPDTHRPTLPASVPCRTVLLVDPHEDSRTIYSAILEHHGFGVVAAPSIEAALRAAAERRPDVVVFAFVPPRARSLEALRAFRGDPAAAAVPMLVLSTTLGDVDRDVLLAEGVAGYMLKPCPPLELLAEIKRLIPN